MILSRENKRRLIILLILTAIVILLQLMGSTISIGEFSISLILIPIVLGSIFCSVWGGIWLGIVFGTVLILTGETDVFWAMSPFFTFISTAIRGALVGLASWYIYKLVKPKKEDFAIVLASITAPLVNTALFIIFVLTFFFDFIESVMGPGNALKGLLTTYVSINFLVELSFSMVVTPIFARLIKGQLFTKKQVHHKNKYSLGLRFTIAVILLGIIVCTISSYNSYKNYKNSMENQYEETAYMLVQTASSYIDKDLLSKYKEEIIRTNGINDVIDKKEYENTLNKLVKLCSNVEKATINVSVANDSGFTTIWDNSENYSFGQNYTVDSNYLKNTDGSVFVIQNIEKDSVDAFLCIYEDNTNNLLSVISVSISLEGMENIIKNEITNSIVMMICIEIIFITMYSYYFGYRVIEPIKTISNEVSGFVENEKITGLDLTNINTQDEIEELASDILKMEKDIGSYIENITAITAEKEKIKAELGVATKIQRDMLPSKFPESEYFNIYASMDPAKEVGGDFYDFFMTDEDHLALVIADVSDKGVPAALFMVVAKTLIKNQSVSTTSPKEILEAVNNQLWAQNASKMFVTVWLCIMEIKTGKCVASNAGHEYPVIRKAGSNFELIKDNHGFVVGGIKNSRYTDYEFILEKNDSLFVYTDGVTEAANEAEEQFGTNRMVDALNIDGDALPEVIVRNIKTKIDEFKGKAAQFDDITMLCIKRTN